MERTLDIFKNDAFSQANLRVVQGQVPFTPQALGQMNMFTPHPIDTEVVLLYSMNGQLHLIPVTDRGAPDIMATRRQGEIKALRTKRLSKRDSIRASELLAVGDVAFPLAQRMRSASQLYMERMSQLRTDMEATKELHRLGALQGLLLDADGTSVIYDYFAEFGVTVPTVIDVDFAGLTEDEFAMFFSENFYQPMFRSLQSRNGGAGMVNGLRVGAFVGDLFWGKLMRHPGIREIWKAQQMGRALAMSANPLATPPVWESIEFGNVVWIHYMGAVSGPLQIPTDTAKFFPMGVPDVFDVYWAPGETMATVQGLGQPEYAIVRPDVRDDPEFVDFILRSYPLYACIYPKALMRARVAP